MFTVAALMANPKDNTEFCMYRGLKIDTEVINRVKAAALFLGKHAQEWASDVLNLAASEVLNHDPIERKPPPEPKPKGGKRRGRPRKRPED